MCEFVNFFGKCEISQETVYNSNSQTKELNELLSYNSTVKYETNFYLDTKLLYVTQIVHLQLRLENYTPVDFKYYNILLIYLLAHREW